jgi:organic radical activating enzyme
MSPDPFADIVNMARAALETDVRADVTTPLGTATVLSSFPVSSLSGLVVRSLAHRTDDVAAAARHHEQALRSLSAERLLLSVGCDRGFRMEDIVLMRIAAPQHHHAAIESWWRRRLGATPQMEWVNDEHHFTSAVFASRGQMLTSQRTVYRQEPVLGNRIRVEAFELHVTEHCNLRCAHCCNMSPYLSSKTLSPAAIAATLTKMATVLHADVFKIMGGEPLLHPNITEVLHAVKASGVGDVVRLFTNGLLLTTMDDHFWRALDHLTISSYDSAPVRADHLAIIEDKAQQFDVVLNVKPVDAFSQVMHHIRRDDDEAVQYTWNQCWLRHRCLVVRDERFYICTRAAYLTDLHDRVALTNPFDDPDRRRHEDSVSIHEPNLAEHMLALLNRSQPLHSCRFCLGGDGPREVHQQLRRADVASGRLHRLPIVT